ncbi:hypothetical protein [Nesterenkonia sp. CF4.4]|uniref:hypothetical protein n=1 Tax=Nesterenkonia sp. CF4.4 TaxID=3373079 RepID=UPI003EE5E17A
MTHDASTDLGDLTVSALTDPAPIRLIRSAWQPDDLHSATRLSAQVAAAELLRVRRGIYVDAAAWVRSPPWIRAQIAVAAMAHRRPNSLFCRDSALLLHGLPLTTPPHVTLRTQDPSLVGISRREPMTASALPAVTGPEAGYWVEPLELALPDAVARLDFPEAVAVLDPFLAQRGQALLAAPPEVTTDPLTWGTRSLRSGSTSGSGPRCASRMRAPSPPANPSHGR